MDVVRRFVSLSLSLSISLSMVVLLTSLSLCSCMPDMCSSFLFFVPLYNLRVVEHRLAARDVSNERGGREVDGLCESSFGGYSAWRGSVEPVARVYALLEGVRARRGDQDGELMRPTLSLLALTRHRSPEASARPCSDRTALYHTLKPHHTVSTADPHPAASSLPSFISTSSQLARQHLHLVTSTLSPLQISHSSPSHVRSAPGSTPTAHDRTTATRSRPPLSLVALLGQGRLELQLLCSEVYEGRPYGAATGGEDRRCWTRARRGRADGDAGGRRAQGRASRTAGRP